MKVMPSLPSADRLGSSLKPMLTRTSFFTQRHISTGLPSRPTLRASRAPPEPVSTSIPTSNALSLLRSEPAHYVVAFLLGKRYRLSAHDLLTVPHVRDLRVGDVIQLTRITEIGSRTFTLRAPPTSAAHHPRRETAAPASTRRRRTARSLTHAIQPVGILRPAVPACLPEGYVSATALVVEHTRGEMLTVIKKKRRKGYRKTIKNKPYL